MSKEIITGNSDGKFTITIQEETRYTNPDEALNSLNKQEFFLATISVGLVSLAAAGFTVGGYFIYRGIKENDMNFLSTGVGIFGTTINFITPMPRIIENVKEIDATLNAVEEYMDNNSNTSV